MKLLVSGSAIVLLMVLSFFEVGVTSCTKDHNIYDTVTVIKKDTVIVKDTVIIADTLLTTEILTSHSWKYIEVRGVVGGSVIYYLNGGTENTESFDNTYHTFNANNTGVLVDNGGTSHTITNWTLSADHTKLVYTAYNDNTIQSTYTWENIRYKNGYIYYDQYFHDNLGGYNAHSQEIRAPK